MKYNQEYLDIEYALINVLLYQVKEDLLSCSFNYESNNVSVLFLWKTNNISNELSKYVKSHLQGYSVTIENKTISKEEFNNYQFKPLNHFIYERADL